MRFTRQHWNLEMLQKAGLISSRKNVVVPQRDSVSCGHNKAAAPRLRQRDSRSTWSAGTSRIPGSTLSSASNHRTLALSRFFLIKLPSPARHNWSLYSHFPHHNPPSISPCVIPLSPQQYLQAIRSSSLTILEV